jgi:hypothetical protein
MEKKLNKFITEVRAGMREGSVMSVSDAATTIESPDVWAELRRELEDVGISADIVEEHHDFIVQWLKNALTNGLLEENARVVGADDASINSLALITDEGISIRTISDEGISIRNLTPTNDVEKFVFSVSTYKRSLTFYMYFPSPAIPPHRRTCGPSYLANWKMSAFPPSLRRSSTISLAGWKRRKARAGSGESAGRRRRKARAGSGGAAVRRIVTASAQRLRLGSVMHENENTGNRLVAESAGTRRMSLPAISVRIQRTSQRGTDSAQVF